VRFLFCVCVCVCVLSVFHCEFLCATEHLPAHIKYIHTHMCFVAVFALVYAGLCGFVRHGARTLPHVRVHVTEPLGVRVYTERRWDFTPFSTFWKVALYPLRERNGGPLRVNLCG